MSEELYEINTYIFIVMGYVSLNLIISGYTPDPGRSLGDIKGSELTENLSIKTFHMIFTRLK